MDKTTAKRKNSALFRALFIIPLLLFCGVAGLSIWGLVTAHAGQAQSPEQAVQAYWEALAVGDFQQVNRDSGFAPSPLCGWQDYDDHLRGLYGGRFGDLTLSEPQADGDGRLTYTVSRDGAPLGEVGVEPRAGQDGWRVFTLIDEDYQPYAVTAPSHLLVAVNGQALSPDNVVEIHIVPGYESLPEGVDAPTLLTYETPPLFTPPQLTATAEDGQTGQTTWEEADRRATVSLSLQSDELSGVAEEAFRQYAAYLADEADMEDLEPLLLPGAALYESLVSDEEAPGEDETARPMEATGVRALTPWGEDAFSAVIDYQISPSGEEEDAAPETGSVTLCFVLFEDNWLLASLSQAP